jgi:hypothetical protein
MKYISLNRNRFANLSKLMTLPFYSRVNCNPFLPHTHISKKRNTTQMKTSVVCRSTCGITVLLYLNQSLHLLMQVAEQHVMCDTGLKRKFFEALTCLGIQISPSIRCDLFNRPLLQHKVQWICKITEMPAGTRWQTNTRQTSYVAT